MPTLQFWQTEDGPRPLLHTNGKFAFDPLCCCGIPAVCDRPIHVDQDICPDWIGRMDPAGCVDHGGATNLCELYDWASPIELDVKLPNTWGGTGCDIPGQEKACSDMNDEILVCQHNFVGFAFGFWDWCYSGVGLCSGDKWCSSSLERSCHVHIFCKDIALPGEPEDLRCFIDCEIFYTNFIINETNNHYIWEKQLAGAIDLANIVAPGIELPLRIKQEQSHPGGPIICSFSGTPSVFIKTH